MIMLTPNADSTYTATLMGGVNATFTNGVASENNQNFTFNSLQRGGPISLGNRYFIASSGSLSLAISQTNSGFTATSGNVSGAIKLAGAFPDTRQALLKPGQARAAQSNDDSGSSASLSGQIIGTYTAVLVPKDSPAPPALPLALPSAQGANSPIPLPDQNRTTTNTVTPPQPGGVSVRERQRADAAFSRGQYYAAMPVYRQLADAGDSTAMAAIGTMYEMGGEGVPKDIRQAAQWHLKAAEAGNSAAMQTIGLDYFAGEGVPKDYAKAAYWLKPAAEAGQPTAMGALGVLYGYGQGVPKDLKQAAFWLRKAAATGDQTTREESLRQLQRLGLSQ